MQRQPKSLESADIVLGTKVRYIGSSTQFPSVTGTISRVNKNGRFTITHDDLSFVYEEQCRAEDWTLLQKSPCV